MARIGFSCDEVAAILGVSRHKASQAVDPALRKIAALWRVNPGRTMLAIIDASERLEDMTPEEHTLREQMLDGRADRDRTHPGRVR